MAATAQGVWQDWLGSPEHSRIAEGTQQEHAAERDGDAAVRGNGAIRKEEDHAAVGRMQSPYCTPEMKCIYLCIECALAAEIRSVTP